jgi:hypothetical protein
MPFHAEIGKVPKTEKDSEDAHSVVVYADIEDALPVGHDPEAGE